MSRYDFHLSNQLFDALLELFSVRRFEISLEKPWFVELKSVLWLTDIIVDAVGHPFQVLAESVFICFQRHFMRQLVQIGCVIVDLLAHLLKNFLEVINIDGQFEQLFDSSYIFDVGRFTDVGHFILPFQLGRWPLLRQLIGRLLGLLLDRGMRVGLGRVMGDDLQDFIWCYSLLRGSMGSLRLNQRYISAFLQWVPHLEIESMVDCTFLFFKKRKGVFVF